MSEKLHYKTTYYHHPDCPLGENGKRAYFEARDAFSNMPPEARARQEDREAVAIAEFSLEEMQICLCGLPKFGAARERSGT